jgi:hypothetical protein
MSNGARFVTLWGQTWKDAGYPIAAIWATMGRIADPVTAAGGLTVPTVFTTAVNDFTSPPGPIVANYAATVAKGTPTAFYASPERNLSALPYLRIPGVDTSEAAAIVRAFIATGVERRANASSAARSTRDAGLDRDVAASVRPTPAGQERTALQLAVRSSGRFAPRVASFFAAHRAHRLAVGRPVSSIRRSTASSRAALCPEHRARDQGLPDACRERVEVRSSGPPVHGRQHVAPRWAIGTNRG